MRVLHPLTHSCANALRRVFSVVVGIIFLHFRGNVWNSVGCAVAVLGGVSYVMERGREECREVVSPVLQELRCRGLQALCTLGERLTRRQLTADPTAHQEDAGAAQVESVAVAQAQEEVENRPQPQPSRQQLVQQAVGGVVVAQRATAVALKQPQQKPPQQKPRSTVALPSVITTAVTANVVAVSFLAAWLVQRQESKMGGGPVVPQITGGEGVGAPAWTQKSDAVTKFGAFFAAWCAALAWINFN